MILTEILLKYILSGFKFSNNVFLNKRGSIYLNNNLFGKNIGLMEPQCVDNPIKKFISISSKCYSYLCKNDIEDNENKLKDNIVHTKVISNSYKNKHIDLSLI